MGQVSLVTIGERIKSARQMAGMTQEEVADKIGVSTMSISKWERAEVDLRISRLFQLVELFDVSLEYFLQPTIVQVDNNCGDGG